MTNEEKYNLIDKYLSNELSGDALKAFEDQLNLSEELQREVALHEEIAHSLKGEKIHELRNVLKEADKNYKVTQKGKILGLTRQSFLRISAIAASILLFVFAYQFFAKSNPVSNEQLYSANFETYKMTLSQRSWEDSMLVQAIDAYNHPDYTSAADYFTILSAENPDVVAFPFYRAISEMNIGQLDNAIDLLTEIISTNDPLFVEQSRWYLALAYLQKGNNQLAETTLKQINDGAYKYDAAMLLLKKIEALE